MRLTREAREVLIEQARDALIRAAPLAADTLAELASDPDTPPAVRARAATALLDRVGVAPGATLHTDASAPAPGSTGGGQSPGVTIRQRLERLAAAHDAEQSADNATATSKALDLTGDVVEAVLVEDVSA